MHNKSMRTQRNSATESHDSALLELSAREVRTLMRRFGVSSLGCAEEMEAIDLLVAGLCSDLDNVMPAPQFVALSSDGIH